MTALGTLLKYDTGSRKNKVAKLRMAVMARTPDGQNDFCSALGTSAYSRLLTHGVRRNRLARGLFALAAMAGTTASRKDQYQHVPDPGRSFAFDVAMLLCKGLAFLFNLRRYHTDRFRILAQWLLADRSDPVGSRYSSRTARFTIRQV
jgi:hypothetical protein